MAKGSSRKRLKQQAEAARVEAAAESGEESEEKTGATSSASNQTGLQLQDADAVEEDADALEEAARDLAKAQEETATAQEAQDNLQAALKTCADGARLPKELFSARAAESGGDLSLCREASFDESTRAAFVAALARKHGATPNDPSWEILRWYFPVPQDIAVACQISIAGWSKKSLAEFWKLAKEDAFENHNGEPRFIKIHSTVHSEVKVLAVGGQRDNVQIWCSWIALEFQQRITDWV
ncbi:unnamed protein product [Polarella glacialis]|uniref:Uncharacterized protein n=1 Tax=Polarella glacialis TaxID=89957 RepID=A0A813E355_POLGL|nr:unnamed protein product [Polarella glacialis]